MVDFVEDELKLELRAGLERRLSALGPEDLAGGDAVDEIVAGLDLYGLEVPVADGGLGMGLSTSIVVCEVLGRWAVRDAYRPTALLADVLAGDELGDGREMLATVAAGDSLGAATCPIGRTVATGERSETTFAGRWVVLDPLERATAVVVLAESERGVVSAALRSDDVRSTLAETCGSSSPVLEMDAVRCEPVAVVRSDGEHGRSIAPPIAASRIRQAAYLLGLAARAHELAVDRAASRRQFGEPIGRFQSIGFRLAAQSAELEALRLCVQRAAWLADRPEAAGTRVVTGTADDAVPEKVVVARTAAEALALAAETALDVCRQSVHIHGASGMAAEAPVGRLYTAAGDEVTRGELIEDLFAEAAALRAPPA